MSEREETGERGRGLSTQDLLATGPGQAAPADPAVPAGAGDPRERGSRADQVAGEHREPGQRDRVEEHGTEVRERRVEEEDPLFREPGRDTEPGREQAVHGHRPDGPPDSRTEHGPDSRPDSGPGAGDQPVSLFDDREVSRFREDWQAIQIAFVDDPRRAVREADELVASVMQSLAATFARHKGELESQWSQGEVPTEDLRLALRQYRSFFHQLLSS